VLFKTRGRALEEIRDHPELLGHIDAVGTHTSEAYLSSFRLSYEPPTCG
jgi:hypothetical protein